jgi:predicted ester cyclase
MANQRSMSDDSDSRSKLESGEIAASRLVTIFYDQLWNKADESVAQEILHAEFRFRGSLGPVRNGPNAFIDYQHSVRAALADFRCIVDELICTDTRAAARMTFTGRHRGPFFGVPATANAIQWAGAAFFTTDRRQITELWVLGDVDAVKRQLGAEAASSFIS